MRIQKIAFYFGFYLLALLVARSSIVQAQINRQALVERHKVIVRSADSLSSLSVGNGRFAFTVDITGLQSFPKHYEKGVPLGTQSEWGWHSFMNKEGFKREEALVNYSINGRNITYLTQANSPARSKAAADWFRQNPHRLQLGSIGFELLRIDKTTVSINEITDIRQELNCWTGEIKSMFKVGGIPVQVSTLCDQQDDIISATVESDLVSLGRLKVFIIFPYPTGEWTDVGTNYQHADQHSSRIVTSSATAASLLHQLDTTSYIVDFNYSKASIQSDSPPPFRNYTNSTVKPFSVQLQVLASG